MTAADLQHRLLQASPDALVAYLTAGYPDMPTFVEHLGRVAEVADAVEIGVPFTDPMADGLVVQETARAALDAGFTLEGLFEALRDQSFAAPLVLASYVNPLLARGDDLVADLVESGISGVVVPDLPFEEGEALGAALAAADLAWIQLVAPSTPKSRARRLARASRGFVYAVTTHEPTGGDIDVGDALSSQLAELRATARVPVLAGWGARQRAQVAALRPHSDGVVVGSALMAAITKRQDPVIFLQSLRPAAAY